MLNKIKNNLLYEEEEMKKYFEILYDKKYYFNIFWQ